MLAIRWSDSNFQVPSSSWRRSGMIMNLQLVHFWLKFFQVPRITCLGVQADVQHDSDHEQEGEEETELDSEPIVHEQPRFQPASKLLKTPLPPAVPTKRSTSARKTDNDIILIGDPIPAVPAPPHASSRQSKPMIAVQTQQQGRSPAKSPAKKPKTAK